ncbi:MAG: invasion associated locus B family protein [Alphaproteobacteria bacterium]
MYAKRVTGELGAIARAGIAALMLVAGIGLAATPTLAADGKKAAASKKAKNFWVKLCDKAHSAKNPKKKIDVCVTHHEQIHTKTGMVLVSVALRQIEGQKNVVMVMVPLGMQLRPGVLMKFDNDKPIKLDYTFCAVLGCYAELEATPAIVKKMKSAKKITVGFMSPEGKLVPMGVPMDGFVKTLDGKPADSKQYMKERKRMMMAIRKKQVEAFKKAKAEADKKKGGK